MSPRPLCFDVVVVGAGPAGCLAARLLAAEGADVLLLERETVPRWKVCGACLGVGALAVLDDAGLGHLPGVGGAVPLRELVVASRGRSATLTLEGGAGWSRAAMDEALLRAAERAGATCWSGTHATIGSLSGRERMVHVRRAGATLDVRAGVVLDAAGLGGAWREGESGAGRAGARIGLGAIVPDAVAFGAAGQTAGTSGGAVSSGGDRALPSGRVHMVVGREGYVGLVRLENGSVDVAAAVDAAALRGSSPEYAVRRILDAAGMRLDGAPTHGWRGTPPLTRSPERVVGPRVFRIGDAMGYVEPFTGEGIGWALASAAAVTPLARRGIRRWDPSLERAWEAYARGQAEPARRLCRAVSWGLRRPVLVGGLLALLSRAPALAGPWIRHAGRVPARPEAPGTPGGRNLPGVDAEEAA